MEIKLVNFVLNLCSLNPYVSVWFFILFLIKMLLLLLLLQEVPENRRRLSVYRGIVMSKQNAGIHTTIRIRRIIAGVGVEIVFPL